MLRIILPTVALLLVAWPLWADHFTVELKVQSGKQSVTGRTETVSLGDTPKKRGVLSVKAGDRITVHWRVQNVSPKVTAKDVMIHFFTAREMELGQKTLPKLKDDAAAQSAILMDFGPKEASEGDTVFTISKAGPYLVRVETKGAGKGPDGHEHFAALEILVQQ